VALILFDVTDRKSFECLTEWIGLFHRSVQAPFLLIGNRIDLEDQREVSKEEVIAFAQGKECPSVEASAVAGQGMESAFRAVIDLALKIEIQRTARADVPVEMKEREDCCQTSV
jgi:GTPase SAR1 family protein